MRQPLFYCSDKYILRKSPSIILVGSGEYKD